MSNLIDKRIGNEIEGEAISDAFGGYIFKITGGIDKDGFAMKNGVLTSDRKRLMLSKGSSGIRFRRHLYRTGTKIRKLVRGCIITTDIRMVNIKIVKNGEKLIEGLNRPEDNIPKKLAPKKATNILKEFGLLDIYNKKKSNAEERKTLRFMITKFAHKREVKTSKGKVYTKRPKIQRLITPLRLRRKAILKQIKKDNSKYTADQKKSYEDTFKKHKGKKAANKKVVKSTKA